MRSKERFKSILTKLLAAAFWIAVWEAIAVAVGSDLIICTPGAALLRLLELIKTPGFYRAIGFSSLRILAGFFSALVTGTLFAALSAKIKPVKALLEPITSVIKATPVASFIILAIIWFGSSKLSAFISFLMVFPVIYLNLLEGIENADRGLLEMADVFGMKPLRRIKYVYFPEIEPFLSSACSVALGLCWKSGVAAEVIGISTGSVGEMLYKAKLYFETGDLLAWTAVIIAVSALFERLFMSALRLICKKIENSGNNSPAPVERSPSPAAEHTKTPPIILKDVYKSYGEQRVLSGFDAEFPSGSRTAIMGRSGAGKTTVINLILGLIKPDGGEVTVPPATLGAVFQEDRLIERLSALGNLFAVLKKPDGGSAREILAALGISGGLETKPVRELSGGERRRVALARALITDPDVLILDEPFKGIDSGTLPGVLGYVSEKAAGKTLILVTHSEDEASALGCKVERV